MKSKAHQFIYHQTNVSFILNSTNNNIMINATQMAKIFDKKVDNFLRLEETKNFISLLIDKRNLNLAPSDVREQNTEKDILFATNKATFMNRHLALYFAFWLDLEFQLWIIETIDNILFGSYKKHWEAHATQEEAKKRMLLLKEKILLDPTPELVENYFREENITKSACAIKRKAIQNQLSLFNNLQNSN